MHYSVTTSALAVLVATSTLILQTQARVSSSSSLRISHTHQRSVQHGGHIGSKLKTRSSNKKKRACKASASSSSSSSSSSGSSTDGTTISNTTASSRSASGTSASSSGSGDLSSVTSGFLNKNGLHWGYLPDEADAGGTKQTMAQINSWTNSKSAFYGYYAQAHSGSTFDGSQLLAVIDDVKASGAIFQPAVMPTGGWQGLTASDNSQAVNIAKVMKQFTDEGIEVWLRFAHEVNWYQTDGTYSGGVEDFQAGWAAVAAAMDQYAPDVKMFFTPNVGGNDAYDQYYPQNGRVDIIGIDYYPSAAGNFVSTMQYFHDKYTSDSIKFAIGETGLSKTVDIGSRLAYVAELTSDETMKALPNYIGCTWFNFLKGGVDFRLVTGSGASETEQTTSFFASSS